WREKQIEYSFRRALMKNYEDFPVCTSQALDYTCSYLEASLRRQDKDELLRAYRILPAFDDAKEGLARSKEAGFRLFAFSNGTAEAVETLLDTAGLLDFFHGVVSVDEIKSFKPDPGVYRHFLRRSGSAGAEAWLVSSNPFDVLGALSAGMRSAWVRRSPEIVMDPWGTEPTITVASLADLPDRIQAQGPRPHA
ncbi:MAG: haloacid dehalogenase type II, partial [bacterium]|nr:haloacid dehalogenase type II [bacterium]